MPVPRIPVIIYGVLQWAYTRQMLRGVGRYMREVDTWDGAVASWVQTDEAIVLAERKGIISAGIFPEIITAARKRGLPLVNVSGVTRTPEVVQVVPDNRQIGTLAAEHLLEAGYRRFAVIDLGDHWYSVERVAGFRATVEAAGHTVACVHVESLRDWLAGVPKPVAVFAVNDSRALLVSTIVKESGLRCPDDVAILGVDNDEILTELTRPMLSSVDPGADRVGYRAAALLDAMMRGEPVDPGPHIVPPVGVVARESTDRLAIDDTQVVKAIRYIRAHSDRPMHVSEVAEHLCVSLRWLQRRFQEVLGRSPAEEIRRAHINQARQLLVTTELPVSEIAERAGFTSAQQFSETFHAETGMSPRAFRKAAAQL